jgi:plasmid stabilization system protein ParE
MVKWTPKSEADLEKILDHISENFNVDLAFQTVYALVDFVEATLSKNPLAGKLFELNPLFSKIVYEGNSIYYCENPKDKNIYIVYVQARQMRFKVHRLTDAEVA